MQCTTNLLILDNPFVARLCCRLADCVPDVGQEVQNADETQPAPRPTRFTGKKKLKRRKPTQGYVLVSR